jgi:hypothetical protein
MTYTICPSDQRDARASTLDLWNRNFPTASQERYAWLYETGPAVGWLLRDAQGAVVGSTGLLRRTFLAGGRVLPAGQAIDLNVDRDHRSVGPALCLGRAVTAAVDQHDLALVYGFPDASSRAVLERIGYRQVGRLGRWAKPLRTHKLLPGWLRHRLLRKAASPIADSLLRVTSAETYLRRPAGLDVRETDRFDHRFDLLWHAGASRFGVLGERTSEYLRWRFGQCPDAQYRVLCLSGPENELLAYLIHSRREGTVQVADFFFADPQHLDVLLAEFLRQMRREKVEAVVVVYLGADVVCRSLKRFGFWKRPGDWETMVYLDQPRVNLDLDRALNPENWFLTRADVDTDD